MKIVGALDEFQRLLNEEIGNFAACDLNAEINRLRSKTNHLLSRSASVPTLNEAQRHARLQGQGDFRF